MLARMDTMPWAYTTTHTHKHRTRCVAKHATIAFAAASGQNDANGIGVTL